LAITRYNCDYEPEYVPYAHKVEEHLATARALLNEIKKSIDAEVANGFDDDSGSTGFQTATIINLGELKRGDI